MTSFIDDPISPKNPQKTDFHISLETYESTANENTFQTRFVPSKQPENISAFRNDLKHVVCALGLCTAAKLSSSIEDK